MNQNLINSYIQRHDTVLEDLLNQTQIPADRIRVAMHYSLFPGGKRIRPVLVYLAGVLIGVELKILDLIAATLELTHCYSLIHDDLPAMDNDDLRRGKPSCHKAYDEATAILVGDGMQALAIELLLTQLIHYLEPSLVITIARILVHASGVSGMVSGQSLDLSELNKPTITNEQLRTIHLLKTGRLIRACFEMVLAAQPATPKDQVDALNNYAMHIGLAFQMQDDYLDHYAPAQVLGKGRASDMANKKITFASLLTQEQLEKEISHQYQLAIDSIVLFAEHGYDLIAFTEALRKRS